MSFKKKKIHFLNQCLILSTDGIQQFFLRAIGDSRVKWSRVGHSTIRTQLGPTSVIMYQYATEIYTTHFKKRFLF